jgi:hypothetical protein
MPRKYVRFLDKYQLIIDQLIIDQLIIDQLIIDQLIIDEPDEFKKRIEDFYALASV